MNASDYPDRRDTGPAPDLRVPADQYGTCNYCGEVMLIGARHDWLDDHAAWVECPGSGGTANQPSTRSAAP